MKLRIRPYLKRITWVAAIALLVGAHVALFTPRKEVKVWFWLRCLNLGTGHFTGGIRSRAAYQLGLLEPDPKVAIPALLKHLKDKDAQVRYNAAISLIYVYPRLQFEGELPESAESVIPDLAALLKDEVPYVREGAATALGTMPPEHPELVVPALLGAIQSNDYARLDPNFWFSSPLAHYGTNARPWSPILLKIIQEDRQEDFFGSRKRSCLGLLAKIDPEVGKPMLDQYLLEESNRIAQAQAQAQVKNAEYIEKQRAKYARLYAESLQKWQAAPTNLPPVNANSTQH